jgi:transposase InsO family protein
MRKERLKAKRTRKFCVTTDSKHEHPIAPNTLDRQFDIHAADGASRSKNRVWVADITYIPTRSDRGSEYESDEYRTLLSEHGISCSMSRKRNCRDSAVAESFFATLKTELVYGANWKALSHTRDEARTALFEYIEVWYNRVRRHSTLGYKSPVRYELEHVARGKAI